MSRMVGNGSAGVNRLHNSEYSRRNKHDRKMWREVLYRSKRVAKVREERQWRNEES